MRHCKESILILIGALLLLVTGCSHLYTPPERPLAYMFPTVMPGKSLRMMKPCNLSMPQLVACLTQMGLRTPLEHSGLQENDLQIIQRGLNRRGYAELDARRTKCNVRWITFYSFDGSLLKIAAEVNGRKINGEFNISPQ